MTQDNSNSIPTIPDPDPFWLHRWHALHNIIDKTIENLDKEDTVIEHKASFFQVLNSLSDFATRQFAYFFFGFSHNLLDNLNALHSEEDFQFHLSEDPFQIIPPSLLREKDFTDLSSEPSHNPSRISENLKNQFSFPSLPQQLNNLLKEAETRHSLLQVLGYTPKLINMLWEKADYTHDKDNPRLPQRLIKDYDIPPEYVLRTTLDHVAFDLERIQRAILQHQYGTPSTNGNEWGGQKATLHLATHWCEVMLERAKELLPSKPHLITYFNFTPRVRPLPYTKAMLLGLPMTITEPGQRRDMLVLGHELGHYVYHYGQIGNRTVKNMMKDIMRREKSYLKNWSEEIFADIFGIVVSETPDILNWAMGMLFDNAPAYYNRDSRVHPIDAVRPHLYIKTLTQLTGIDKTENAPESENDVITKFTDWLKDYHQIIIGAGSRTFFTDDDYGKEQLTSIEYANNRFTNIISRVLELFTIGEKWEGAHAGRLKTNIDKLLKRTTKENNRKVILPSVFNFPWPASLQSILFKENSGDAEDDYKAFQNELTKVKDEHKLGQSTQTDPVSENSNHQLFFIELRDKVATFERPLEPDVWKVIFAADGWVTRGPENQPTGGWEADWQNSQLHR